MDALFQTNVSQKKEYPQCVYHYCSVPTMLSIIENSCLWMSDGLKTNDSLERVWLKEKIKEVIEELFLGNAKDGRKGNHEQEKQIILDWIEKCVGNQIPATKEEKYFLLCFSEQNDLLSQWRAYGDDGKGVAIGFNTRPFLEFNNRLGGYSFSKVIYDRNVAKKFVYDSVNLVVTDLLESVDEAEDKEDAFFQVVMRLNQVIKESMHFKDPSFEEEDEWRLIRRINSTNYTDSDGIDDYGYSDFLEGIFADNKKNIPSFERSKLKYRARDNDIITYMELKFKESIRHEIIKEIVLGPKCNISETDLKILLLQNGYIKDMEANDILIRKSAVPYR